MDLGGRVRAKRRELKLSQDALARRADVSLSLINQMERGLITDPHYSTLRRLASALDMSVSELVEEEPTQAPLAQAPPETAVVVEEEVEGRRSLEDLEPMFEAVLRDRDELLDALRSDLLQEALGDISSELEYTRDPAYRMMLSKMLDRALDAFRAKATRVEYTREARPDVREDEASDDVHGASEAG